ncbi:IS110 family transposase [Bradyrhizobium algeriense]|uniref:IS110 family transposase n=1 Tax=Bradyrhizobium algeriense TaxID=634784 RepID=UPI001FCE8458|nr:IS110 family transposase [Bradyrhizobium algeriense]
MEARTVKNLPPAATHDDAVRCLLAIELSKKSWIVAVNTPLSDRVSRHTLKPCDGKELLDLCERIRTRVARETKQRVEIVSCYEAGYDGFWLHRLLEAHGIRNYVIDPASLQVDRRARRAKTDHVDVERLLRSLMAYLRGEPKVWSVVRVPSVAEEDNRRLHRERGRLINERIQHVNRINGLLAIHGIYEYQPLRRDRMQQLERLRTADGRSLPPRLMAEILRELQRLELVIGMIKTIEMERDAIASAKTEAAEHTSAKKIQDLATIKCIGPEFSNTLVGEVFYRSFDNRKQLASYVGLTPAHFQSGATCRDQGISKAGNAKARTVMIELAWLWLRHQPDSPLSIWFRDRVGKLKGRIRRITIVAVARKLLIALWRYLETGLVPEGAALKV